MPPKRRAASSSAPPAKRVPHAPRDLAADTDEFLSDLFAGHVPHLIHPIDWDRMKSTAMWLFHLMRRIALAYLKAEGVVPAQQTLLTMEHLHRLPPDTFPPTFYKAYNPSMLQKFFYTLQTVFPNEHPEVLKLMADLIATTKGLKDSLMMKRLH